MLFERYVNLAPLVNSILSMCGGNGAVVGVLQSGVVIHKASFGSRDSTSSQAPDENTTFQIASVTKAFTAAALGILVDEGKLRWDTPIQKILPEFHSRHDPTVTKLCTVVDLLAHRTGNTSPGGLWCQGNNQILIDKKDTLAYFAEGHYEMPFRSGWAYSSIGYAIAGLVVESLTGQAYADFVKERIFEPLGMRRTAIKLRDDSDDSDDNIAGAFASLRNRTTIPIIPPSIGPDTYFDSAGGIRSTMHDLLLAYNNLLDEINHVFRYGPVPKISVFKQVGQLVKAHNILPQDGVDLLHEHAYGLGWARAELPGQLGFVGPNRGLLGQKNMPVIGQSVPSTLILYHQGDLTGSYTSVILLPELSSALVVLTNSYSLCDCADWIGQLYLEALLSVPERTDFVALARRSAQAQVANADRARQGLLDNAKPGTQPRDLKLYLGKYWNSIGNYYLEIRAGTSNSRDKDKDTDTVHELELCFQGVKIESYPLRHYHDDVFEYMLDYDEIARRGRLVSDDYQMYLLSFVFGSDSKAATSVKWVHDDLEPDGETFRREEREEELGSSVEEL